MLPVTGGVSHETLGGLLRVRTGTAHREHIKQKLQVHNVAELTRLALEKVLVVLPQRYYESYVLASSQPWLCGESHLGI